MKKDYIIQTEKDMLVVEVQKNRIARSIMDELIEERKQQGLTQQDIADRTGMKAPNVTRVESCKYTPTLDVLERYASAVGKQLKFELVDIK